VQSVPGPTLSSTVLANGSINFSWNAIVNTPYAIQAAPDLGAGWTTVGNVIIATNTVMNISIPIGTAPKGFYRVVMSPQ
jgi:hypothetical protein